MTGIFLFYQEEFSIKIRVLGSSSSGNSTLVWDGDQAVLIDFGFSQKYTLKHLEEADVQFSDIKGAFLTHTHSDHITKAMYNKLKKERIPVYCPGGHFNSLNRYSIEENRKALKILSADETVEIGSFKIQPFEVPHDAPGGCFGYNIWHDSKKITIATDMAHAGNGLANYFLNSDVIIVESNYDPEMLDNSGRSAQLISRIKNTGHLSNEQCAAFLDEILHQSEIGPQVVVLAHLSAECNHPDIARKCSERVIKAHDLINTELVVAKKNNSTEIIEIE